MPVATSSILSNWVPQPELHLTIEGFIGQLADNDGTFKFRYCHSEMLSKFANPSPESAELRRSAAFDKLQATEVRNKLTNRRLRDTKKYPRELHMARLVIADILGEFNVEDLYRFADFSNGASQSRLRKEANKFAKFDGSSHITEAALPYVIALYKGSPALRGIFNAQQAFNGQKIAYSNTLFTVPKSNTIDRVCAKEPDWNMYFQKGLGTLIRKKLKRKANIDLNDQSINRELARIGSIKNNLATLDLQSASDSITTELVYQLLPRDWFEHLDRLRCPLGTLPNGKLIKWNLFSTMGNGYTFELESLIFYGLAKAVCYTNGIKGKISVYGDDIIVPTEAALPLIELLEYCGFRTNEEKSFYEGPFRESCGGHYYNGQDVTPFYIKSPILHVEDLVLVLNKLRKWASQDVLDPRTGEPIVCDPRLSEFFRQLVSLIPNAHLIYGGPIELSGRYISGRGNARYHLVHSSKRKRQPSNPRYRDRSKKQFYLPSLNAYAYWLANRRDEAFDTDVSETGRLVLRRNGTHSNGSAPLFSYEYEGDPVEL